MKASDFENLANAAVGDARATTDGDASSEQKRAVALVRQQHEKTKTLIRLQDKVTQLEETLMLVDESNVGALAFGWREQRAREAGDVSFFVLSRCAFKDLKASNRELADELRQLRGDVARLDESEETRSESIRVRRVCFCCSLSLDKLFDRSFNFCLF